MLPSKVIKGYSIVKAMEAKGTESGIPSITMTISDCGEITEGVSVNTEAKRIAGVDD